MALEYCICTIGIRENGTAMNSNVFYFEKVKYFPLTNVNVSLLIKDVRQTATFSLKPTINHYSSNEEYLGLFFKPDAQNTAATIDKSYYRIINQFFEIPLQSTISSPSSTLTAPKSALSDVSITELYSMLRNKHLNDSIPNTIPTTIECTWLRPILRTYQNSAVRWMLNRENNTFYVEPEFIPIHCKEIKDLPFYFNPRTLELLDHNPGQMKIPTGGILADEMGLGKTVEILALILLNKKRKRKRPKNICNDPPLHPPAIPTKEITLKCLCTKRSKKKLIQCSLCFLFQHRKCVGKYSLESLSDKSYLCPECWQYQEPIESAATFIVSPPSIKMQWQSEIVKHVSDPNFKVLIYNGIKQCGWISPNDLAKYDMVLTDYNIMKSEIYFSATNKRSDNLRNKPRFINPVSPLTMIHWWRVCLDEAQMVETPKNNCSQMVKSLAAVHRWAVTGTPIEKSIDNLYGLLFFLGYEPYSDFNVWKEMATQFYDGNPSPLVNILKNVMWRTCKSTVWKELNIPPQTEIVHNVTMYDIQAFFYTEQHRRCATAFREKTRQLGNLEMFRMNPQTIKLIMEPLRKLRQDCSVPTIFNRTDQSVTKKVLNPDELLHHLISNNEIDCKSELRTVASSLNGLAALYIIKEEYESAEKMYKHVLRWAKDYTGTISVDSLLQIHALHNLIDVMELQGKNNYPEEEEYQKEYKRLEWKYIEHCSKLIKEIEEKQLATEASIKNLSNKLIDGKHRWWSDIIFELDTSASETILLERIIDEIRDNFSESAFERITSIREIAYIIQSWLDRVSSERRNIQKHFRELNFFAKNLKPSDELDEKASELIENLVRSAFECHLNEFDEDNEKLPKNKKKKKRKFCQLCRAKEAIKMYECVIFNKIYVEDETKDNTGTWRPTLQESMLKIIHSHAKKDHLNPDNIQDGDTHLAIIDGIKNEFKDYRKLWIEINYAASAYDELKMCKSRLQAVDPDDMKDSPVSKSKLNISFYEIDDTQTEITNQLEQAKLKFIRLQGTLKYLQHLEKKDDIDVCPICQQEPEGKYSVLECGHHLCMICLTQMMSLNKQNLVCSVCRNKQKCNNIYYVTCKRKLTKCNDDPVKFHGEYSKKVEEIVRTVLRLRQDDCAVKIIIFSQWASVLAVIANAMQENSIEFREKSTKFFKSIDDFKDNKLNVTCLLLPLSYGSKGLNLIEATHIILVEPILNPGEELQAIGRIHRIGQTRPTFVHRFIVLNTIEETIWKTISTDKTGRWTKKDVTVEHLQELFTLHEISKNEIV